MMRLSETSSAPTCLPRQAARSRVAIGRSMKYCCGVGRTAARRTSTRGVGRADASMGPAYPAGQAATRAHLRVDHLGTTTTSPYTHGACQAVSHGAPRRLAGLSGGRLASALIAAAALVGEPNRSGDRRARAPA